MTAANEMGEVTYSGFDSLFDLDLTPVLLNIFQRLDPGDYDACVRVCHAWRVFIGKNLVCHPKRKQSLVSTSIQLSGRLKRY